MPHSSRQFAEVAFLSFLPRTSIPFIISGLTMRQRRNVVCAAVSSWSHLNLQVWLCGAACSSLLNDWLWRTWSITELQLEWRWLQVRLFFSSWIHSSIQAVTQLTVPMFLDAADLIEREESSSADYPIVCCQSWGPQPIFTPHKDFKATLRSSSCIKSFSKSTLWLVDSEGGRMATFSWTQRGWLACYRTLQLWSPAQHPAHESTSYIIL